MRKRTKKKSRFPRLMLAILLASVLFGAGFYAYYQRSAAQRVSLGSDMAGTLVRVKTWVVERKQSLHDGLKASKTLAPLDAPRQEEVKFEFYNSLADMRVNVDSVEQGQPASTRHTPSVSVTKQQKQIAELSKVVVNHDELEQEFKKQLNVTKTKEKST